MVEINISDASGAIEFDIFGNRGIKIEPGQKLIVLGAETKEFQGEIKVKTVSSTFVQNN